jgi:hypothetical protein
MKLGPVLAALLLSLSGTPAIAAGPATGEHSQHLDYQIYAAGLNAVTASLDMTDDSSHYRVTLKTATRGLLGKIVPWEAIFDTTGTIDKKGGLHPALHRSTGHSPKDDEVKEYRYGSNGAFLGYKVTNNGKDETPKTLDPKLTERTIDALTGALGAMRLVESGGQCEGISEVFDGDRRYRLTFHDEGEDMLAANSYNVYEGKARRCAVEVVPVAGKWHTKPRGWLSIQEQGRKKGALPTVWMAKMERGAPAVPVRMKIVTDYGTLYMHVTGYHNDQTPKDQMEQTK